MIPSHVLDRILAWNVVSLARGLPLALATRTIGQRGLGSIINVTYSDEVPITASLVIQMLTHCKLAAAAGSGRIDILDRLRQLDMLEINSVDPLVSASAAGHLYAIHWLTANASNPGDSFQIDSPSSWNATDVARVIGAAALERDLAYHPAIDGGHVPVLQWLLAHTGDPDLFSDPLVPVRMAKKGRTQALTWWYSTCARPEHTSPFQWNQPDLVAFAWTASSALLRQQYQQHKGDLTELHDRAVLEGLTASTAPGRATDLEWWQQQRKISFLELKRFYCARSDASIEALDWWWDTCLLPGDISWTTNMAISAGRVDILDWAYPKGLGPPAASGELVRRLVYDGRLNVLQWYHGHGLTIIVPKSAVLAACETGRVEILDWMARTHGVGFPCKGANALDVASQYGWTSVLEWWLLAARDPSLWPGRVTIDYTHASMDNASNIEALEWWRDSGLPMKYTSRAIERSLEAGQLDVLAWWKYSELPLWYGVDTIDRIYGPNPLPILDWWWQSKLPIRISSELHDRRSLELEKLNRHSTAWDGKPPESVLRWWEAHVFRPDGEDRVQVVEGEDGGEGNAEWGDREKWLESAAPSVLDLVLALAVGSLARGLPHDLAVRILDPVPLQTILAVTSTARVPRTARLGLHLLKHCQCAVAAGHGRLDILKLRQTLCLADTYDQRASALVIAARFGHEHVVRWLLNDEHALKAGAIAQALGAASEHGHLALLPILYRDAAHDNKALRLANALMLDQACTGGSIAIIEWWIAQSDDPNLFSAGMYARRLAEHGHTRALSWWYHRYPRVEDAQPLMWDTHVLAAFVRTASPALLRTQLTADRITALNERGVSPLVWHWQLDTKIMAELSKVGHVAELAWWRRIRGLTREQLSKMVAICTSEATIAALDWWWALGLPPRSFR
ncbi:hypothetical protein BC828DRAFT_408249, partial [Blastocladiella britannica]